eukprot:1095994-Pelagomonas_calceolata.AAC.3
MAAIMVSGCLHTYYSELAFFALQHVRHVGICKNGACPCLCQRRSLHGLAALWLSCILQQSMLQDGCCRGKCGKTFANYLQSKSAQQTVCVHLVEKCQSLHCGGFLVSLDSEPHPRGTQPVWMAYG